MVYWLKLYLVYSAFHKDFLTQGLIQDSFKLTFHHQGSYVNNIKNTIKFDCNIFCLLLENA